MRRQITIEKVEPIITAVVRSQVARSELPEFVPAACGEVWNFIHAAGLPRPGRHLALYLGPPGCVEVGAEVLEPFLGNDRVICSQLPNGLVARSIHYGPYLLLPEAHSEIRQWCADRGHRLANTSWEIYDHWDKNWNVDPSKIRTDVFYLLDE